MQLMATADTVIIKPGIVLRQPITSITDAGQNTCIQLVPVEFACRTPATPNHSSVSTAPEIARPNNTPMSNTVRFVKENLPFEVGTRIVSPFSIGDKSRLHSMTRVKTCNRLVTSLASITMFIEASGNQGLGICYVDDRDIDPQI